MRTEKEIIDLIMEVARRDERVRLVGMGGSRMNPSAPRDIFQDYDVAWLVTDMPSYLGEDCWLDYFGERLMMQKPAEMVLYPSSLNGWHTYLMLFKDGNRIDLALIPVEDLGEYLKSDGFIRVLVDKDGRLKEPLKFPEKRYPIEKPSLQEYNDCCNEFW